MANETAADDDDDNDSELGAVSEGQGQACLLIERKQAKLTQTSKRVEGMEEGQHTG